MRRGFLLRLAPDSPHAVAELALSDSFFLTAEDSFTREDPILSHGRRHSYWLSLSSWRYVVRLIPVAVLPLELYFVSHTGGLSGLAIRTLPGAIFEIVGLLQLLTLPLVLVLPCSCTGRNLLTSGVLEVSLLNSGNISVLWSIERNSFPVGSIFHYPTL